MNLKFYRIDRSFLGKVGRTFKKPDLPARNDIGGIFGKILRTYKDVYTM